ncbi:hypothetical protein FS837_012457 [Tulasnella sp. UAMH 9824]|nr:hypothetical protein FS837_012457 [Tulasnella sp. UAMH 9824]
MWPRVVEGQSDAVIRKILSKSQNSFIDLVCCDRQRSLDSTVTFTTLVQEHASRFDSFLFEGSGPLPVPFASLLLQQALPLRMLWMRNLDVNSPPLEWGLATFPKSHSLYTLRLERTTILDWANALPEMSNMLQNLRYLRLHDIRIPCESDLVIILRSSPSLERLVLHMVSSSFVATPNPEKDIVLSQLQRLVIGNLPLKNLLLCMLLASPQQELAVDKVAVDTFGNHGFRHLLRAKLLSESRIGVTLWMDQIAIGRRSGKTFVDVDASGYLVEFANASIADGSDVAHTADGISVALRSLGSQDMPHREIWLSLFDSEREHDADASYSILTEAAIRKASLRIRPILLSIGDLITHLHLNDLNACIAVLRLLASPTTEAGTAWLAPGLQRIKCPDECRNSETGTLTTALLNFAEARANDGNGRMQLLNAVVIPHCVLAGVCPLKEELFTSHRVAD